MKHSIEIALIQVDRGRRQRKEIGDISDLEASLSRIGLINPLILDESNFLIAGERRLEAAKKLGWTKIDVRYKTELSLKDRELLELDENMRRKDLPWRDQCAAVLRAHELIGDTVDATADTLGYSQSWVTKAVIVGQALRQNNPKIKDVDGIASAYNILARLEERALSAELTNITGIVNTPSPFEASVLPEASVIPVASPSSPISQGDFLEFAAAFKGRPFNLLHCDFPYGINHDRSDQGGAAQWGSYADSPDTYWALCKGLISAKEKLLQPSAHIIFWFSLTFYSETLKLFQEAGFDVQPFPLIWHKTDSKGILPDPTRGPRRVYETALLMSLGDRKIIRAVDNVYGCPTSKTLHLSEKPEPMLRHFFRMLVDEYTELLDPTCGSGNAILAAARLGAKRVQGLEIDPSSCEVAQVNFKRERNKDLLSEKLT